MHIVTALLAIITAVAGQVVVQPVVPLTPVIEPVPVIRTVPVTPVLEPVPVVRPVPLAPVLAPVPVVTPGISFELFHGPSVTAYRSNRSGRINLVK
ncbi:hypothetical protein V3C99_010215, partial [Haemonchus contortus]